MPALSAADRRLFQGAAAFLFLFLIVLAVAGPGDESSTVPSVYSSESGGARAAYLLLRDLHFDVRIWEAPPTAIQTPPSDSLLILAEPGEPPSDGQRKALKDFVTRGGRVLFCGAAISSFFPHTKTIPPPLSVIQWKEFAAVLPGPVTRGADRITLRPDLYWGAFSSSQIPLYTSTSGGNDSAVVVSWRIGGGEILWWASATPLTNAGITQTGNLNLFLNSVTGAEARPATIYWDEYFHGERPSLTGYIVATPVLWASAQILLVFVALLFTWSRRSGPIVPLIVASRLSPLEFVDTMGALYRHANASAIPVDVTYRHLRLELTRRLGLSQTISDAELARAASDRLGFDRHALSHALSETSGVRYYGAGKLRAREALALVQTLETFLEPKSIFKPIPGENHR